MFFFVAAISLSVLLRKLRTNSDKLFEAIELWIINNGFDFADDVICRPETRDLVADS